MSTEQLNRKFDDAYNEHDRLYVIVKNGNPMTDPEWSNAVAKANSLESIMAKIHAELVSRGVWYPR